MNLDTRADEKWIREQGAKGTISVAACVALVMGEFRPSDPSDPMSTGHYPVYYLRSMGQKGADAKWYHYDQVLDSAPTRGQILEWLEEQHVSKH